MTAWMVLLIWICLANSKFQVHSPETDKRSSLLDSSIFMELFFALPVSLSFISFPLSMNMRWRRISWNTRIGWASNACFTWLIQWTKLRSHLLPSFSDSIKEINNVIHDDCFFNCSLKVFRHLHRDHRQDKRKEKIYQKLFSLDSQALKMITIFPHY